MKEVFSLGINNNKMASKLRTRLLVIISNVFNTISLLFDTFDIGTFPLLYKGAISMIALVPSWAERFGTYQRQNYPSVAPR